MSLYRSFNKQFLTTCSMRVTVPVLGTQERPGPHGEQSPDRGNPQPRPFWGREAGERALILHGSQRAVLAFGGLVSRQRPSNPQQGPPGKAPLFSSLISSQANPLVSTRDKATAPSMEEKEWPKRFPKKIHKINQNNSRPGWRRLGCLWRKHSVLAPLTSAQLVYRGHS